MVRGDGERPTERRTLGVVVSMDCERVTDESLITGTPSWDMGRRAVLGLAELLDREGFRGTFLPTPDTAARQATLFAEVAGCGSEVGLQFHCRSFWDLRYSRVLGHYDREQQRAILSQAKDVWEQALSRPLLTFRSGFLSASDDTFPILASLGVKQTSCSKAGRYRPEVGACWLGALPYAHRASATCRLESGALDLVEVPVSSHPAERFSTRASFDPRDPRPDSDFAPDAYREIVDAAVHEMALIAPPVATFVILTHNTLDYGSPAEPRRAHLVAMLRRLRGKESQGWQVTPATLTDVRCALVGG